MAEQLWVDDRHPDYKQEEAHRAFARDHFTGAARDISLKSARWLAEYDYRIAIDTENLEGTIVKFHEGAMTMKYLFPRAQGEPGLAFFERARITRYPAHMSTLVESYVGGVFAVEREAARDFEDSPLGNPDDPESVIAYMSRDIDGTGTNWDTRLMKVAVDLIVDGVSWYLVDRRMADDPIRIYRLDPTHVVNWREEDGILVEVLVHETEWVQESLKTGGEEVEFYTHYELDGWTRYRVVGEGSNRDVAIDDAGAYSHGFYTDPKRTRQRLPIGRVKLPVGHIGYRMAQDANDLYNLLSDARWLYRVLNHPRLRGMVDDQEFQNTMDAIRKGHNAVQGDWDYISPRHENAASAYQTYRDEVREYYISNHQRANQSAIERSATEVLYNEAAGRVAFLSLFAGTIDEVENDWLFLASQWEAPESPDTWLNASVKRSRDFKPIDVELLADRQANRFGVYVSTLPTDLALEISGHDDETVRKFREYDPVPEEGMFNGTGEEESEPEAEGEGLGLGQGGLEATLAGIADGLDGSA